MIEAFWSLLPPPQLGTELIKALYPRRDIFYGIQIYSISMIFTTLVPNYALKRMTRKLIHWISSRHHWLHGVLLVRAQDLQRGQSGLRGAVIRVSFIMFVSKRSSFICSYKNSSYEVPIVTVFASGNRHKRYTKVSDVIIIFVREMHCTCIIQNEKLIKSHEKEE